jgi:hypothetical protein
MALARPAEPNGHIDTVSIATFFADALNRERGLTQVESELLGRLLSRAPSEPVMRRWSGADDRDLLRLHVSMTAPQIAQQMDRTPWAIRSRLRALKRKARTRQMSNEKP